MHKWDGFNIFSEAFIFDMDKISILFTSDGSVTEMGFTIELSLVDRGKQIYFKHNAPTQYWKVFKKL